MESLNNYLGSNSTDYNEQFNKILSCSCNICDSRNGKGGLFLISSKNHLKKYMKECKLLNCISNNFKYLNFIFEDNKLNEKNFKLEYKPSNEYIDTKKFAVIIGQLLKVIEMLYFENSRDIKVLFSIAVFDIVFKAKSIITNNKKLSEVIYERLEILEGDSRESYIFNLFKVDNVLSEFKKHFDYFYDDKNVIFVKIGSIYCIKYVYYDQILAKDLVKDIVKKHNLLKNNYVLAYNNKVLEDSFIFNNNFNDELPLYLV
tara:strand:- start:88 stop:864 length:777 start_codon:yes stop_codon:yes gene_type:complete